jgi:hypothetical protein
VIPRLAKDIANEMPELKGFSERNIGRMIGFYREYPELGLILPRAVAKLAARWDLPVVREVFPKLPWAHHVALMGKVKDPNARVWYMCQTLERGWSRDVLALQIDGGAYERAGKAIHNCRRLQERASAWRRPFAD